VIIYETPVKADWFCSKVHVLDDIKTIPDQTNNLAKAFRAAVGNFVAVGANYKTAIPAGVLELGTGYYRLDKTLEFSKIIGGVFYRLDGFRLKGQGPAASYLVRTDLSNTDYGIYALYTSQLTEMDHFKITAYNPDGTTDATKYSSSVKAMMFLQGDSLLLHHCWVAGAQIPVQDSNGVYRNGVGIQFSSCVDTYMTDMFFENCVTAFAVGSGTLSATNIELYTIRRQSIGLGIYIDGWNGNAVQTTSSQVYLSNIQSPASVRGVHVLETGVNGTLNITNSLFDGFNSEFGTTSGFRFMDMGIGTTVSGSISNTFIKNFSNHIFYISDNSSLGSADKPFFVSNLTVKSQTTTPATGVFYASATGNYCNLIVNGIDASDVYGILLNGPLAGYASLENVNLSGYRGQVSASSSRSLFTATATGTTLIVDIRKVRRNTTDTTALTQFGFMNGGTAYIDIDNLYNATRIINGSGFTATMPTKTAFS
jgi:hypothetical protein